MKNHASPTDPAYLMALSHGFWRSQVLFAGNELGIFDALADRPLTPAQLARRLKLSLRGADILLHALASLDLLRKKGEAFGLTPLAAEHLVAGRPGYMGNILRHTSNLQARWAQLPQVVRSGKPARCGAMPSTVAARRATRNFILGMADLAAPMAHELFAQLDFRGVRRVLDVGGGPGTYLFTALAHAPDATGVIFDQPHVVPIARASIARHGLRNRVTTAAGDFNTDPLGKGFDLAIMSNVLHSNSPSECRQLIRKGFRALNPGGRLVVNEFTLARNRAAPPTGALFAVNMLVGTEGGMAYSAPQITDWMRAAGFRRFRRLPLEERATAVIGVKI